MSKTRLIPFDLEKAKTGAKLVTRDGYPARLIFDSAEGKPLVALIKNQYEEYEFACLFYNDGRYDTESFSGFDLFIEENVEEPDDYNPYKETVESIADMVERYANNGDLQDFYDNVKAKCKDAFEYDKKWNKEQEEQKPSDEFKIMPDKWYVCTLGWESCGWDGDWKFVEGSTYLGSEILQCYPMDEKEIQDHVRLWTICDAKPGDILATKNGYNILIFKNIKSSSGSGFSSYYNYNNFSDYSDFKEGSWNRDRFIPATKEQRDFLFQKMKEAGYEWDSDKKELKKIEKVKTRRMTNQELADWLRDAPEEHREYRYAGDKDVYNTYDYPETEAKTPVEENRITIRRNHGEWQKPLIEE